MTRVLVLVEGQTEEAVVQRLLKPSFDKLGVHVIPVVVQTKGRRGHEGGRGGGRWKDWRAHLERLLRGRAPGQIVTTLFDLYGLPNDFPRYAEHMAMDDTLCRVKSVEEEIANFFGRPPELLPYVQRHELESLLLVSRHPLEKRFSRHNVELLWRDLRGASPEDVNCGVNTAPSKRVMRYIPEFRKVFHGPAVLEEVGLAALRGACPRFNEWVSRLEKLAP